MIRPTLGGKLLTRGQLEAYHRTLASSHRVALRLQLLNPSEKIRAEVAIATPANGIGITGGQVDVDTTSGPTSPTRQLTLTLLDPRRRFHLAPDSVADYGLFVGDMIRVLRGDLSSELGGWVWCPVFTGPVTGFQNDYPEVTINAVGKESLLLDPWLTLSAVTATRGTKVATAVRRILEGTGERKIDLGGMTARIGHRMNVPRLSQRWLAIHRVIANAGRTPFYDGRGYLRAKPGATKDPVYTFRHGADGVLLQAPELGYDFTSFHNTADVSGGTPKKTKKKVHAIETVARGNPLSPGALARNGAAQYAVTVIDDANILRRARAIERGRAAVAGGLLLSTDPSASTFDSLAIPHLEEGDLVRVQTEGGSILLRLSRWTIPLDGDSMPVGVHRVMRWRARYRPTRRGRRR